MHAEAAGPFEVWDADSGSLTGRYLDSKTYTFEVSPQGRYLAAVERENEGEQRDNHARREVVLIDVFTQEETRLVVDDVFFLRFSPRGSFLVVSGYFDSSSKSYVIETSTRKKRSFAGGYAGSFTSDERFFCLRAGTPKTLDLQIWSTDSWRETYRLSDAANFGSDLERMLVVGLLDGLSLLDMTTSQMRRLRAGAPRNLSTRFSPDRRTLSILLDGGKLEFWDVATGKLRAAATHSRKPWSFHSNRKFSPDSRLFAVIDFDGSHLSVWDVHTGTLCWARDTGTPEGFQFTADSRFLISTFKPEIAATQRRDVFEASTGAVDPLLRIDGSCTLTDNARFALARSERSDIGQTILGRFWPFASERERPYLSIVELGTLRELGRLDIPPLAGGWLAEDGRKLVTLHKEGDKFSLCSWDVPFSRRWELVIGIPAGVGLLLLLYIRWRMRVHS